MRRLLSLGIVGLVTGVLAPAPGYAQQSVNFYVGGFVPRSLDARTNGDVIFNDRTCVDRFNCLLFNLNGTPTVGGEWEFPLISHLDGSLGIGISSKSFPSVNANLVNSDGTEIRQTLKLRIVPITALVRFLPLPRDAPIQPYIGAGVGIFSWRYSETGGFVDSTDNSIFQDNSVGSGWATGPVVIGGVTVPLGSLGIGFEARYQSAAGNLPGNQDFAGPKIDLGGLTYSATFKVRF
jgi:hypothetical protein